MTTEQLKELREIRSGFLLGLTSKDLLYIKMQINKLDTLIYEASKNIKVVSNVKVDKKDCEHLNTFIRYDLDKIACVDCRKILE